MRRVLCVIGTRPEAIKLAPVIRELRGRRAAADPEQAVEVTVCVTAQHRTLVDRVLATFGLVPDHDLDVMEDEQTPTRVAAQVMTRLEPILERLRPDWVVVQGDTTTVLAATLAAFYQRLRVAHVEAGLRSGDKWRPFPEEVHRRLAAAVADLHLAPTAEAREALLREGVASRRIVVTGNPVLDAFRWALDQPFDLGGLGLDLAGAEREGRRLVVVTAHRRENFGPPLERICLAVRDLADDPQLRLLVAWPVHPNPAVRGVVQRLLAGHPPVVLLPPLDYVPMAHLLRRAHLVLTDSGGLQEEAPSAGTPVLVLREVTERPEALRAGGVRVIGTERAAIVRETRRLLTDDTAHRAMAQAGSPYGDGQAARRIVDALLGEPGWPGVAGPTGTATQARRARPLA